MRSCLDKNKHDFRFYISWAPVPSPYNISIVWFLLPAHCSFITTLLCFLLFTNKHVFCHTWPCSSCVCTLRSRSQCLHWPSMMDDGVYRSSIPLALLPLIGLKRVHLGSTSMVTSCVYVWITPSLPPACLIKTGPRQDSPQAFRIHLASKLCFTAWLSLENSALMQQKKKRKKMSVGTATDMIPEFPTLVAMEICSICSVT